MTITKINDHCYEVTAASGYVLVSSDHSAVYSLICYTPTASPQITELPSSEASALKVLLDSHR